MPCTDVSRSRPCKPEIKLIATDMDGTLLNSRGQIDESFLGSLRSWNGETLCLLSAVAGSMRPWSGTFSG